MKKTTSIDPEANSSEEQVKTVPIGRVPVTEPVDLPPAPGQSPVRTAAAPSPAGVQSPVAAQVPKPRAHALQGQVKKTSIEERVKQIQAQRAKQKEPADLKAIFDNVLIQLKAFATTLIKGKPNVSKSAKDFPINRNIVGRMKRYGPAKVYRLKGYTTVGRVKKKRSRDLLKKQRNRLIFLVILAIFLLVLFFTIDPIPTIRQFLFNIGY